MCVLLLSPTHHPLKILEVFSRHNGDTFPCHKNQCNIGYMVCISKEEKLANFRISKKASNPHIWPKSGFILLTSDLQKASKQRTIEVQRKDWPIKVQWMSWRSQKAVATCSWNVNFPSRYGNYGTHCPTSPSQRLNLPGSCSRNEANPHGKQKFWWKSGL